MKKWFWKNLAVISILLSVFSLISYMAIIDALVFWTNWGGQIGEIGGVLDYQPYGSSSIYHVTANNTKGRLLFTFPDLPLYALTAIACLNIVALFSARVDKSEDNIICTKRMAAGSVVLSILSMVLYVWGTMMFIDRTLKFDGQIGGSVYYMPALYVWITHVYNGHIESFPDWQTLDSVLWVITFLIVFILYYLRKQFAER